jgi:hypothetical protein
VTLAGSLKNGGQIYYLENKSVPFFSVPFFSIAPGAAIFKTEPIPLALREPIQTLPETGPLGIGMVLWIACTDADVLHDLILKRGGVILSPLAYGPFGRFFVARDPDDYAITFHTART